MWNQNIYVCVTNTHTALCVAYIVIHAKCSTVPHVRANTLNA
nr:MAG TPA: hypothetical protein [Myoviridae sp. ct6nn14]